MQKRFTSLSLFILFHSVPWTSGQNLCPDPDDILPCICIPIASLGSAEVECDDATSSDDIYFAFNDATWPVKNLTKFSLMYNDDVRVLPGGVFGDTTFDTINLAVTSVSRVDPAALLASKDRLLSLVIDGSPLREFPWEILPQLANLKKLDLRDIGLTTLPLLQSDSLEEFSVSSNEIDHLEAGWSLPNLRRLYLSSNPIRDVPAGFLSDFVKLEIFSCADCDLGPTLSTKSLEFHSESMQDIHLSWNSFSNMEVDAITGLQPDTVLYVSYNDIRELTEESFRPMLKILSLGDGFIFLGSNPVECDCSMAWVVLNPDFLASVNGYCMDGTEFKDLDPNVFEDCVGNDDP
ncbi:unnamed protein product [Darwinula stevensoni]|uniref:Uncharacterized protein n=1 Tax=Darwinula stevensoni TaxID=69355 RepID=A0A7R8XAH7_9CRUS|nr:unnamed protein product [Darwinula stevensoni]CAG0890031.1 unnamed protein product [Darwinula stevensoni]